MRQSWIKIIRAYFVPVCALVLSACGAEDFKEPNIGPQEVGFYVGDGTDTRTEMLPNGLSAVWTAGDELAVWARNSAGDFTLSNQVFKTYGIDGRRGFFTSTLNSPMPEGDYIYYCTYPAPISVKGTKATFNIPAVQDGKVSGGADIMIATPVQHGALTPVPNPEDHSGMSMEMNRMMHQFRFFISPDDTKLGDLAIEKILLDFPKEVVGKVTLDFTDSDSDSPSALTGGTGSITMNLSDPLTTSDENGYDYACVAIIPTTFDQGHLLQLKAYTDDKIVFFNPVDLSGKESLAGHSTPVKLNVSEVVDYAGIITFTLTANNLGENPNIITFKAPEGCYFGDGGSNVFVYDPGREINVGERIEFKFETDAEKFMAFSGKQIQISYDSENAVMNQTLTMPSITQRGRAAASLTVPYLLFEDFSGVLKESQSYGNNSYESSEREQPGASLNGVLPVDGWSAARYWTKVNGMRINTRYQEVKIFISFSSYHHGRLDTPALNSLKPGRSVTLKMDFGAGGYIHSSSNKNIISMNVSVATHDRKGVLDGIPTGKSGISSEYETTLNDFGYTHKSFALGNDFGDNAFGEKLQVYSLQMAGVTSADRICFYPTFTVESSGYVGGGNAEFNVYLDDIKVQIAK